MFCGSDGEYIYIYIYMMHACSSGVDLHIILRPIPPASSSVVAERLDCSGVLVIFVYMHLGLEIVIQGDRGVCKSAI